MTTPAPRPTAPHPVPHFASLADGLAAGLLNPGLHAAMHARLGAVHVRCRGEHLAGYYETDPLDGRRRLRVVSRGETYYANCPICGDTRQRLAVNHRYGVKDLETGYYGRELWKCFNEECQHVWVNRQKLRQILAGPQIGPTPRPPDIRLSPEARLEACEFPGILTPLRELAGDHPARGYVTARGFDPDELDVMWGVAYAEYVPARTRGAMAQGRLIIPVTAGGVQVGWQARYVGELDWKAAGVPKYLTYFPKSLAVYGLDQAASARRLVLVEGVTDVWRYGPGAVATLGKTASPTQCRLLAEALRGRPLVLVPDYDDPDSEAGFARTAAGVAAAGHAGPVAMTALPGLVDPAALPRDVLHRLVDAADVIAPDLFRTEPPAEPPAGGAPCPTA